MNRITAVQLDDLLSTLTPDLAAELREHAPVAYADQLRAAQTQSEALASFIADPGRTCHLPPTGIDDWLRLGLLDTFITWTSGQARTCTHMPDWRRPRPVLSCAWKPGLVVCARCTHLLRATPAADKVCDLCGHTCTGVEHYDGISVVMVVFGALTYQAGACLHCVPSFAPARKETA